MVDGRFSNPPSIISRNSAGDNFLEESGGYAYAHHDQHHPDDDLDRAQGRLNQSLLFR
jgi:hypothetical protein